jgi:hypothetical protein
MGAIKLNARWSLLVEQHCLHKVTDKMLQVLNYNLDWNNYIQK